MHASNSLNQSKPFWSFNYTSIVYRSLQKTKDNYNEDRNFPLKEDSQDSSLHDSQGNLLHRNFVNQYIETVLFFFLLYELKRF